MENTLELPALGRRMCLGTLYDCRSHQIISPGTTLWDPETISSQRQVSERECQKLTPMSSESFNEKSETLEIDRSLQASILAKLVEVKGSAKYLDDNWPPEGTCRLSVHSRASTTFEHVTLNQLDSCKVQNAGVFAEGKATHVVTGILYGSNTCFVFDKKYEEDNNDDCLKTLDVLVTKFTSNGESAAVFDSDEVSDVKCKVYCDLDLESNPSDCKGAAKLRTRLPEILKENAVPIKFVLYPLYKIDTKAARVSKVVSNDLLSQVQDFLEGLEHCFRRTNKMAADPLCIDFPQFAEKFAFFKRMLSVYKMDFQRELARVLPLIQGGSDGESILKEMLQNAVSMSPFKLAELKAWLDGKRKEVSTVRQFIEFLPDEVEIVKSRDTLDDTLINPGIDNVVCWTFRLAGQEEGYLTALYQYIATTKESSYSNNNWYDDPAVRRFMREKAKLFCDFFRSNPHSPCTKFIATGFGDDTSVGQEAKFGGTVLLYEQGALAQEDFEPPSRPGKPKCKVIDHNTVDLTWSQPEYGASSVQKYIVNFKRFHGQNQADAIYDEVSTESSETSVSIKNLEPDETLEFRVVAVCAVGVSPESESSGMMKTLPASPPGTPVAHPVSATSIGLEWDKPPQSGNQVTIRSYIISFWVVVNGAPEDWQQTDTGSPERRLTVRDLVPNTSYVFQVVALYDSGVTSLSSVDSNICTTLPVSQPGKPEERGITASSVTVQWTGPALFGEGVVLREYFIEYTEVGEQSQSTQWTQVLTNGMDTRHMVQGLKPNKTYKFRTIIVCENMNNFMLSSEPSAPVTTLPAGPPTNITADQVSTTDIVLAWDSPALIGQHITIKRYRIRIECQTDEGPDVNVVETETDGPSCTSIINGAAPETRFKFSVTAVCAEDDELGESSDVISFETFRLLRHEIRAHANLLQPGNQSKGTPCILQFPIEDVCLKNQSQSYRFGSPQQVQGETHKVIMVVGVTGSGKSTLINGMINHILDVDQQDDFRFKIIVDVHEGKGSSQAHSQTQVITSYTIYRNNYLSFPYTLTVIDTPGFGDTRGIGRDKEIIDQIREFFLDAESHGVDHIDAIGFVVQASQVRLTQTQRYVFDSILSVFGKDIAENIILLVTFADSSTPPVLAAVEEANIPYKRGSMFKFNNASLFTGLGVSRSRNKESRKAGTSGFEEMFWQMGKKSLSEFFREIQTLEAQSLVLTKEVLDERKRLEAAIQGLQRQIQSGICKLEELKMERQALEQHEAEIKANKDFSVLIDIQKSKKIDITGEFITNCSKCHCTCHYPCAIGDDTQKAGCAAMQDGVCTVCPGKCVWDVHFNQQYRFEYYTETESRTFAEIEARYNDATGKKMTVEQVIKKQIEELKAVRGCVCALIDESRKRIMRLEEIALKPNPLSTVEYVDMMIQSEKSSHKPGWKVRISTLQEVREEADIMSKVKQGNYDPFEYYKDSFLSSEHSNKTSWFKRLFSW